MKHTATTATAKEVNIIISPSNQNLGM